MTNIRTGKLVSISNTNHLVKLGGDQLLADIFNQVLVLSTVDKIKSVNSGSLNIIDCRINRLVGDFKRMSINDDLCKKLMELSGCINDVVKQSYLDGKEDGKQLLIRLNNGEVTLPDFEK